MAKPASGGGKTARRDTAARGLAAKASKSTTAASAQTVRRANDPGERDFLRDSWRRMLLIRRFEEKAGVLYGMKLIGGFCHLYIGQEAVVTGVAAALRPGDQLITSYRDHGHMLAAGMAARGVMAELTGRATGYSGGKGGSMHMFSVEQNFYGGHGIVGAQVSLGTGLAFANHYRGDGRVAAIFMGEGASNQGQVFESLNLAALLKLPALYIIENNRYGMGTSVERASASRDLSQNGAPWGIPGVRVDGMDVRRVRDAAAVALEHCRSGQGPYLIEMSTYRFRGHSMSDPAKYRTREEVTEMREHHDPLAIAQAALRELGMAEEEFAAIEAEVRAIVEDAAEFAKTSPEPDPAQLYTHVLVEG